MNTNLKSSRQSGNALLVALAITTLLAASIAGYLMYVQHQAFLSARSQSWNLALSISEAGIEEALQQLNSNGDQLSADGWSHDGNVYYVQRTFANGDSYIVYITNTTPSQPHIVSRAFVNPPTLTASAPGPFYADANLNNAPSALTRAVYVTASKTSLLLGAMVAKHQIDMNGQNVLTDSFDSGDITKSNNGQYDATRVLLYDSNHGDVASNDGVVNAVNLGNANIYGHVATGPLGTVSIGTQGGVGTHEWQSANGNVAQPGWVSDNANFIFPEIRLPYETGLTPAAGDVVEIKSISTNSVNYYNQPTPPSTPPAGFTLGPITTNISHVVSSTYPGVQDELGTNTTWLTVSTYPGVKPGLITNCVSFTTTSSYPGAKPCLSTNCVGYKVNACGYPSSWCKAGGLITNSATGNGEGCNSKFTYYENTTYSYASTISYTYSSNCYSYTLRSYTYTIYEGVIEYETNHYDHVLYTGDYVASDLSGSTIVVGNARLVMPEGLSMSGQDKITIGQSGSLKLYSGGDDFKIAGNGVLNKSGVAGNCIVNTTATDAAIGGNGTFIGVLIAPYADMSMNGGGSEVTDFVGSIMANTIRMNGHYKFHYDEALSRLAANGRYHVRSWKEIP